MEILNTDAIVKSMSEASKELENPISQVQARAFLNLFRDSIASALSNGKAVKLNGFITVKPSYRAPRKGNNVLTGKPMDIPGCVIATVKAGKALRDATQELDESDIK